MNFDGEAFSTGVIIFILIMLLFFGRRDIPIPLFPQN